MDIHQLLTLKHVMQTEEFHRSVFNQMYGHYTMDLSGRYIDCNDAVLQVLGYEREQILAMNYRDLIVPKYLPFVEHRFDVVITRGIPQQLEFELFRSDGCQIYVSVTYLPIKFQARVIGIYGIAINMTRLKQAELQLAVSKERYKSLMHHNVDGIFAIDESGCFVEVNPALEKISGYEAVQLHGRPYFTLLPESEKQIAALLFQTPRSDQHTPLTEYIKVRHQSGHLIETLWTAAPIYAHGQHLGFYGIVKDMSEQRVLEKIMRESESMYRILAENTMDLIGIIDSQGMVIYASPSHIEKIGYDMQSLEGRTLYEFIAPLDAERIKRRLTVMPQQGTVIEEFELTRSDRTTFVVEGQFKPVYNCDGKTERFVYVLRDISGRKHAEELLIKTEKLTIAGQLAAGLAHEIRNPLTAIKGFIQLIQEKKLDRTERRYYKIMTDELNRIELILTQLLILAKPQAAKYEQYSITSIMRDVYTLCESQALMKNITIDLQIDPIVPWIHCDANQLKQVFINFVKNGIEAMGEGGEITITVRKYGDKGIVVHVEDQGCGIPEELMDKLGEPFYSTKENGTGLGLMVSYKIIEEHNGKIDILSKVGEGTKISVYLPTQQSSIQQKTAHFFTKLIP